MFTRSGSRCRLWDWQHVRAASEMIFCRLARSTSTTSPAGRARRSCPCASSRPAGRYADRFACELRAGGHRCRRRRMAGSGVHALDGALAGYQRRPHRGLAGGDRPRCSLDRRPPGGGRFVGRDPAAVGVLADGARRLRLSGSTTGDAQGPERLDGFTVEEDGYRRLEACQSPVWDSGLAAHGAARRRPPASHPALESVRDWLVGEEVGIAGDWACAGRRCGRRVGFEFANDHYPDIDDSAVVALALHRLAPKGAAARARRPPRRRLDLGMQSRTAAGALRRREHADALPAAAVLRLRRGDRPASVDVRACGRAAGRTGVERRGESRASATSCEPGAGRQLVRPLGRQPGLRDRRRRARAAGSRSGADHPAIAHAVRFLEQTRTRRRMGRGSALLPRSQLAGAW